MALTTHNAVQSSVLGLRFGEMSVQEGKQNLFNKYLLLKLQTQSKDNASIPVTKTRGLFICM